MNFKTNFLMVPRNTNKPIDVEYNEYLKIQIMYRIDPAANSNYNVS